MTKRDCMEYCIKAIKAAHTWTGCKTALDCKAKVDAAYADCMDMMRKAGYVDGCADDIWCKAVDRVGREQGIHPDF